MLLGKSNLKPMLQVRCTTGIQSMLSDYRPPEVLIQADNAVPCFVLVANLRSTVLECWYGYMVDEL
jgi:hypothetical protein